MRILFFTECYAPIVNGVVVSIQILKRALQEDGHQVTIVTPHLDGRKAMRDVVELPSFALPNTKEYRGTLAFSASLQKKFPPKSFDLIHTHHPFLIGWLGLSLARAASKPCVFTYHTHYTLYTHYIPLPSLVTYPIILRWVLSFCQKTDLVLCPGKDLLQQVKDRGCRTPTLYFPTWIEGGGTKTRGNELLKELGVDTKKKIGIFVGRLAPEKNISFLFDTFALLPSKTMQLLIIGEGPSRKPLQKEAKQKKLKPIIFSGALPREDVLSLFKVSDLFLFASETETQGLVILEALSCGLPVVALKASGVSDIIHQGQEGILCSKEPSQMAEAIYKLLHSPHYAAYKKRAKERATQFSKAVLYPRLLQCYRQLLNERSPLA